MERTKKRKKAREKEKIVLKIGARDLKREVLVPVGTRLWDAVREAGVEYSRYPLRRLNGRKLKEGENPILTEDSLLILGGRVKGGLVL